MDQDKIIALFKDIGLSENEAKVYFAMLSIGSSPVQRIAKVAGVKRTTVYSLLESLKDQGLARVELFGLKQKFTAEDPEKLENTLDLRYQALKDTIPQLRSLYVSDESSSTVKYYQGLNAIKGIYDDLLKSLKMKDEYLAIVNIEKWQGLDEKFFMGHVEERAKMNVSTRLLFQDSEKAQWRKKFERNFNEEIKILPQGTMLNTDLVITPNKLVIFQLDKPYIAFVIENKATIETQKQLFEIIWESIKQKFPQV